MGVTVPKQPAPPASCSGSPLVKVQIYPRGENGPHHSTRAVEGGEESLGKVRLSPGSYERQADQRPAASKWPDICHNAQNGTSLVPVVLQEKSVTQGHLRHSRQRAGTMSPARSPQAH